MTFIKNNDIECAKKILENNGVIAFPTETVYGLGAIASEENYKKMVNIKKRPPDKPFTLMISSLKQVDELVEISDIAKKIIDKFAPGPITIILKSKKNVPHFADLGSGFIGIRIPQSDFILKLIDRIDKPLLVPSANPSGLPPATSSKEVYEYFNDSIDGIVEGNVRSNIPSTIVKVENNEIILLREGEISLKIIEEAIK